MNVDQVSFALRIRLDGEQIYFDRSTSAASHVVELERPYVPDSHEIQFEIPKATRRRSTFQAHLTFSVSCSPTAKVVGTPSAEKDGPIGVAQTVVI